MDSGVNVAKLPNPALEQVLTPEALAFLVALERKFGPGGARNYARVAAVGKEVGIAFDFDAITVQPNTLNAHRLMHHAAAKGREDAVAESLFRGYFQEGAVLTDLPQLTALGVRAVPQDYLNVARVLKLSRGKTLFKIMLPAALPYMFTGFRLSLGIAWLVIVAAEMLTGAPGVGGFLWQEYNALIYEHIILCILTIGLVGFGLDRLMGVAEKRLRAA